MNMKSVWKFTCLPNGIFRAMLYALLFCTNSVFSQHQMRALDVEIFHLDNGLTVYLNEDHSLPNVFGAVGVKGGSKRDPADATGIAHYFEHIMFKGTDSIGTLDYQSEKMYLDSIATLYDQLGTLDSDEEKARVQSEINRISLAASQFAIPNEISRILKEMGGTMVNAGTSNEDIIYYNCFPGNQVEKWLRLYGHRFEHPVYRLFQSELETVYEEYNRKVDDRFANVFNELNRELYPNHPYGVPVIGYPEDLKNPSLKKMDEYFRTFYVANNMGLFLSGNFNRDEVIPMIEKYFGKWRTGTIPPLPSNYSIEPFEGRKEVVKRLTPLRIGARIYRTVPHGHDDAYVLDMIEQILSNEAMTGLLDDLYINHKVMTAGTGSERFQEAGNVMLIFVPKIVGQSLRKAEKLATAKLEDIKSGNFDEKLLEAIKTQRTVNYERAFEEPVSRGFMMFSAFSKGREWDEVISYPKKINAISREDVIRVANTYFGNDYLVFYSKTGFPKKPKALKPSFAPIPERNTDKQSEFAQDIARMPVKDAEPDFIKFGPPDSGEDLDVTIIDPDTLVHLYYVKNKINNLFNLTIKFGIGEYEMPGLEALSEYLPLLGTEQMTLQELSGELQELGASCYFDCSQGEFIVYIYAPDIQLDKILELTASRIYEPKPDRDKIKNLAEYSGARDKVLKKEAEYLGNALYSYAVYGDHSPYINNLSKKEIRRINTDSLHAWLNKVVRVETDIHYSGGLEPAEVVKILQSRLRLDKISIISNSPPKNDYVKYDKPVVYFLDNRNAIQSKDYIFLPGGYVPKESRPYMRAFMEYIDGGMESIIFQEVREFRSLAYSTGAFLKGGFYMDDPVSLSAYVGTQADKSKEAIEVLYRILNTAPQKNDRLEMVRKSLIESAKGTKPGFRTISQSVAFFNKQNYTEDPARLNMEKWKEMRFDDIVGFYNDHFLSKPSVITIIGDKRKTGYDWMTSYGKVIQVKEKNLFKN